MIFLFFVTSILFFLWIIKNILFWMSLWQIKEYRLDRLIIHFTQTEQGKNLFISPLLFLKWIGIISYLLVIFNRNLLFVYELFVLSIFVLQTLNFLREVFGRGVIRPIFTIKTIFIIGLTFFSILFLFRFPLLDFFVWLLILDRLSPIFIFIFVSLFSIPTEFYYDIVIERATKKIKSRNDLVIVGVTGSYGKSSTKDYIAQILEKKYRVLKTQGTNNTPIGIARTILEGLRKNTEIFVVEMGAYKKGEISSICQMVNPTIGVLTAVSNQHLSLFGSPENIKEAKYELIQAVPKDGLALFNGNNKIAYDLYKHTPSYSLKKSMKSMRRKILYKTFDSLPSYADIFACNIFPRKTHISFDVVLKHRTMRLITPLIGIQNVENILPGIFIGKSLGMIDSEIKKAVSLLLPLPKTMNRHEFSNGLTIIDDTFNANPEAVMAAVSYMKLYKGKKILVLQPMIELGRNAEKEHYRVGKEVGRVCDYVFLTNKNFYESIMEGIKASCGKSIVRIESPLRISKFIAEEAAKGDIAVFEGKEAGFALNAIL